MSFKLTWVVEFCLAVEHNVRHLFEEDSVFPLYLSILAYTLDWGLLEGSFIYVLVQHLFWLVLLHGCVGKVGYGIGCELLTSLYANYFDAPFSPTSATVSQAT